MPLRIATEIWIKSLLAAMISGSANSFLSGIGIGAGNAMGITHMPNLTFPQMGEIAIVGGLVGAAMYLAKSPVPPSPTGNTQIFTRADTGQNSVVNTSNPTQPK